MQDASDVTLSPERPWPGMRPYREQDAGYFFGRSAEVADLLARTERSLLTLLYGRGGLGKTSLVRAGLAPRLVERGYLPVYLRPRGLLDGGRDPIAEVMRAIEGAASAGNIEATARVAAPTLWELFHRESFDLWDATNRLVTPVLVFDQFEEIFQIIDDDASAAPRVKVLLDNIAELVENRLPARLSAGDLPADDEHRFDINSKDYRVILSFREDYLPQVRKLRTIVPSVIENHVRLEALSGKAALEVVESAGRNLIDHDAATMLVRGAGRRAGLLHMLLNPEAAAAGESADSVAGLEADPAILSVVCFYLNAERQKRGRSTIDVGLVKLKTPEAIFDDYYRMAVSQVDPVAREFIETSLVTAGGERVLYPMRAVESQGSALAGAIKGLLDQGILRKEWFAGEQRLEISHDLLLGPIRQAVQDAKAAAARARSVRRRWQTAGAVVLGLLGTMALVLWRQSVFFERERRMDTLGQLIVALLPDDLPDDLEARFRISVNDLPEEARKLLDPATPNTEPVDVKNQVTWLVTVEPRVPDLQRLLQLTTGIKQAFDKSRRGPDLLMNTVQWVQAKVDRNNWQPAELASLESQLHGAVNELCRSDNMSPEDDAVTWFKTRSGIPPACRGQ